MVEPLIIVDHGTTSDTDKEIARLKKELRDKEDALEILKKVIGILNNDYLHRSRESSQRAPNFG